jgi:hypothetical protein
LWGENKQEDDSLLIEAAIIAENESLWEEEHQQDVDEILLEIEDLTNEDQASCSSSSYAIELSGSTDKETGSSFSSAKMTSKTESALDEFRIMSYQAAYDVSSVTGHAVKSIKVLNEFKEHFMIGKLDSIYDRLQAVADKLGLQRDGMLKILIDAECMGIVEAFEGVLEEIGVKSMKKKYTYVGVEGVVNGKGQRLNERQHLYGGKEGKYFLSFNDASLALFAEMLLISYSWKLVIDKRVLGSLNSSAGYDCPRLVKQYHEGENNANKKYCLYVAISDTDIKRTVIKTGSIRAVGAKSSLAAVSSGKTFQMIDTNRAYKVKLSSWLKTEWRNTSKGARTSYRQNYVCRWGCETMRGMKVVSVEEDRIRVHEIQKHMSKRIQLKCFKVGCEAEGNIEFILRHIKDGHLH